MSVVEIKDNSAMYVDGTYIGQIKSWDVKYVNDEHVESWTVNKDNGYFPKKKYGRYEIAKGKFRENL